MDKIDQVLVDTANNIKTKYIIPASTNDLSGYKKRIEFLRDLMSNIEPVYVQLQNDNPESLEKIALSWKSLLKEYSVNLGLSS